MYFELDNALSATNTSSYEIKVNGDYIGSVEWGGSAGQVDDSFWNGEFTIPPYSNDRQVKIEVYEKYSTSNAGNTVEAIVTVIGYIK